MQKTYETYKDSGIEWIGNVPSHWEVFPMKYKVNLYNGNSIKDDEKPLYEDDSDAIPYIATKDVNVDNHSIDYENGMYVKNLDHSFVRAPKGSSLMCIEGGSAGRKIGITNQEVAFINKLCCFTTKDISILDNLYLYFYLQSSTFKNKFTSHLSGLIGGVSISEMKNFEMICPPLFEQQAIAEYLDKNCSKIDALIAELEQQVTDLGTMKKAEISRVVTKGLNPDAPLKESEIEWIGKVPSHWEISKIKFEAQTSSGSTPRTIAGKEKGSIIWVRTTDLNDNIVINSSEYLSEDEYKSASCPWLSKNTLLISMYGGAGSIGKCGLLGIEATVNQALCAITFKSTHIPKYYFYLGIAIRPYWMKFAASTRKDPNISQEIIRNTFIPVPSQLDQLQIVEYLDTYSEKVDATVKELQDQIADLKLYKQSIISEAVTGKINVID